MPKNWQRFLPKGEINVKYKAQMNLEMFSTGLSKGLFIVADPDFEINKKVTLKWIDYNQDFTTSLMEKSITFWKNNIFPKLLDSVKK